MRSCPQVRGNQPRNPSADAENIVLSVRYGFQECIICRLVGHIVLGDEWKGVFRDGKVSEVCVTSRAEKFPPNLHLLHPFVGKLSRV
jgi:hypothetical protein